MERESRKDMCHVLGREHFVQHWDNGSFEISKEIGNSSSSDGSDVDIGHVASDDREEVHPFQPCQGLSQIFHGSEQLVLRSESVEGAQLPHGYLRSIALFQQDSETVERGSLDDGDTGV